jgi:hypothetical protein
MTDLLTAAQLGLGAVVRRNGLKCTKKYADDQPWEIRRFGRFADDVVDGWIAEGTAIQACCSLHGVGDHDPIEHASGAAS